jgi:type IV pilus assembly protein PilA
MLNRLTTLREEHAKDEKGFTLIELLVVVVIIGILIAIAIPLYLNYQKGAKNKAAQSDLRSAVSAVEQCITDNADITPAVPTGNGTAGANLVFTCGTGTQTANVSSTTTLTYAKVDAATYTIAAVSTGGKSYAYNSAVGGQIQ